MGGSGSKNGTSEGVIRYAPYLEWAHDQLLSHSQVDGPATDFMYEFNKLVGNSPYTSYLPLTPDSAFFGDGYVVSDFPSLYDMFGKFMAGLDVDTLWGQVYENTLHGPDLANAVAAHSALLTDDVDTNVKPHFVASMRNMGSVLSTTFINGLAIIEAARTKSVSKFAADIQIHALDVSERIWSKHLDWNKSVIDTYQSILKQYYTTRLETDKANFGYAAEDRMWNINLFTPARGMLSALNGAAATDKKQTPAWMQYLSMGLSVAGLAGALI